MSVFYEKGIKEGIRILSEDESKHCAQVLRHKSGDEIQIYDGLGGNYRAILNQVSKKSCGFEVIESKIEPSKGFHIHLAIAPTKNSDRMEWMVEKLAEIGVDELTFIQTKHSERRKIRLDRFEKKAISAMKQSGNPFKIQINELKELRNFINEVKADQLFIAHVDDSHQYLNEVVQTEKKVCILIGPEGDFSNDEIDLSNKAGFKPVSLGQNTLRTETAGLIACCQINTVNKF